MIWTHTYYATTMYIYSTQLIKSYLSFFFLLFCVCHHTSLTKYLLRFLQKQSNYDNVLYICLWNSCIYMLIAVFYATGQSSSMCLKNLHMCFYHQFPSNYVLKIQIIVICNYYHAIVFSFCTSGAYMSQKSFI